MRGSNVRTAKRAAKGKISAGQLFPIMLFHPLEAFDIIKLERDTQIKVWPAILLVLLAGVEKYASNFLVSFQFRQKELSGVNLWIEMAYVIIPFAVWVIANFCMTAIMDGESKPKEIFVTSAYCLAPFIVLTPVRVWVVLLLFFALLRQNDYGQVKAIGVTLLCILFMVIFMAVFIFLASLTIQLVSSVQEVFQEIERKYL